MYEDIVISNTFNLNKHFFFFFFLSTLGTRVAEHAGVSFRSGVPLKSPPHSAVRDHSELCSTNVDINNFKVLANSSSEIDLKILES